MSRESSTVPVCASQVDKQGHRERERETYREMERNRENLSISLRDREIERDSESVREKDLAREKKHTRKLHNNVPATHTHIYMYISRDVCNHM